jgi:hypothetical protein
MNKNCPGFEPDPTDEEIEAAKLDFKIPMYGGFVPLEPTTIRMPLC